EPAEPGWLRAVKFVEVVACQAHLFEVVAALHATRGFTDHLDGGDEQADQDGDDCYHHQQLDQRETAAEADTTLCHDRTPLGSTVARLHFGLFGASISKAVSSHRTSKPWRPETPFHFSSGVASQILMVPSELAVARRQPSGLKATPRTLPGSGRLSASWPVLT